MVSKREEAGDEVRAGRGWIREACKGIQCYISFMQHLTLSPRLHSKVFWMPSTDLCLRWAFSKDLLIEMTECPNLAPTLAEPPAHHSSSAQLQSQVFGMPKVSLQPVGWTMLSPHTCFSQEMESSVDESDLGEQVSSPILFFFFFFPFYWEM